MEELNTQQVLDNLLKDLWKLDKDHIETEWKSLKDCCRENKNTSVPPIIQHNQ